MGTAEASKFAERMSAAGLEGSGWMIMQTLKGSLKGSIGFYEGSKGVSGLGSTGRIMGLSKSGYKYLNWCYNK